MQKFIKVPLVFLFVGSLLGLFLRWQFILPTPGTNYSYFLHGHSHVMFLGWIFNALYIGFTVNHIPGDQQRPFQNLFIVLQVLVVGMLISFPLQGYGFYSILFSTLHTLVAIIFIIKFFRKTKPVRSTSSWYARVGLLFFILSTAGPFALGYLMSAGLGQTQWYYFSIYFYLHFQYNGFFLFGILSLFFGLLEKNSITFSLAAAKATGVIFALTCLPAYLLSILWAKPGLAYNVSGAIAALTQIVALAMFGVLIANRAKEIKSRFRTSSVYFFPIVLICFTVKIFLQLLSAWPVVAQMTYELRPVVIAYLHLVLVGMISLFLFVWFVESEYLKESSSKKTISLFVLFFAGMEICLVLYPWWRDVWGPDFPSVAMLTFLFSAGLALCSLLLLVSGNGRKPDKDQETG